MELRRNEEKELFKKLTVFVGNKLDYYIENNLWTATEIARTIKTQNSRITEIRQGQRVIPKKMFAMFIKEGFFKMEDVKREVVLTDQEKTYLDKNFGLIDDIQAAEAYFRLKKAGLNPAEIMNQALEKK